MIEIEKNILQLKSLNHISILCTSLEDSLDFYENVLGFFPIRRPESLPVKGAWLFGHGIAIHLFLVKDHSILNKKDEINPHDKHISFQCNNMWIVEKTMKELGMRFVKVTIEEDGYSVDQLFFQLRNCYISK